MPGIKVEEICGGENRRMPLWLEMAYQLYGENGKDTYREIGHFRNGAPFLVGEECRISISHTKNFLVIATLPSTPEVSLESYSERAALGVDVEASDRVQVLKLRPRFLSDREQQMVGEDDVFTAILAWTCKEAMYKAALCEGVDFTKDVIIHCLPQIGPATVIPNAEKFRAEDYGEGTVCVNGDTKLFLLYSYESEGNIVTIAFSPKCAKFGKDR